MPKEYRKTAYACYLADMIQAVVINLTPLLFVLLKDAYGLRYSQFGTLVFVNFATQVLVDIGCSKPVDRYGYRPFVVAAHFLCGGGLCFFALTPWLLPGREFAGFLIGTVIFAGAGGLFELLLSPIVDALPSENKAREMSLLHSMYAVGKLGCIILTTLALVLGLSWQSIVLTYAALPFLNALFFFKVPLVRKCKREEVTSSGKMLMSPTFLLALAAILFSGGAECTMSQWSSTFMQEGLDLPKAWGDLLGVGGFALMLGLGRLVHGLYGYRFDLSRLLVLGSCLAVCSYLVAAVAPVPWMGAAACALTGFFVSISWPGTLSMASASLPKAGTALFALLAAGGDMGGSIGPWIVGKAADMQILHGVSSERSLKNAIFLAALLPLTAAFFQWRLGKARQPSREGT
ncbi:MAG: MFS transporter [Eubacteriales bacterium]|nr:MFS transporter [Eubacteriales bacterium]